MEIKSILGEKVLIEWRKMQSLQPDNLKLPYNIAYLKQSLIENNFAMPFFGWQNGEDVFVVDGHQRLQVLMELESEGVKIPELLDCQLINAKDRKEAVKILLKVYNQRSNPIDLEVLTEWINIEQVEVEVQSLNVVDINDVEDEIQEVLEAEEDDFDSTPPETPETVLGDIYEIGEHRLLCGDSTCSDTVAKLMNGKKADMVFTDPPYGMKLDADYSEMSNNTTFAKEKGIKNGKKYENVIGDHNDFSEELINTIFACFYDCKEIFIWGADYFAELLPNKNEGSWIVWDKRIDENFDKMYGSAFELCWSKSKHKREIARIRWASAFGTEKEFDHKRHHPTQKPTQLASWFFNKWSKENDLIVDLYLGSGTSIITSHQLKRKCYGMELDPKYCDVILKRMIKLDSNLKIKRNGVDETKKWLDKIN